MVRCIRVTGFGFVTYVTYEQFVKTEIQDDEEALGIAKVLLADPNKSYIYSTTSFAVVEVEALRKAVIKHEEWINKEIR